LTHTWFGQLESHSKLKVLEDCPDQGWEGAPDAWVAIDPAFKVSPMRHQFFLLVHAFLAHAI